MGARGSVACPAGMRLVLLVLLVLLVQALLGRDPNVPRSISAVSTAAAAAQPGGLEVAVATGSAIATNTTAGKAYRRRCGAKTG